MMLARRLPRFRAAQRALSVLAEREAWSRQQIEAFQLERLNQLWRHARQTTPYYRTLAEQHALPEQFEKLAEYAERMPVLDKQQLRTGADSLLSETRPAGAWHRTGGSTGTPLAVYWSHAAHREMLQHKYRMEQAWGVDLFDPKAFLWGHAASFAQGWRGAYQRMAQPWIDRLRNRTRLNAYHLGRADLERYLRVLQDRKIVTLYGYSSAVALLAEAAARQNVRLPHLRLAILTAEPADSSMLAACREGFGAAAAIEYGSVECGMLATGMPDGTLRVCEDVVYLETVCRDDGFCDLLVTVLNNPSFPLFRYAIEDVAPAPLEKPETGYAVLESVAGRSNDFLISRSGSKVHSLAVKHALEALRHVRRFRATQDKTGGVTLWLETAESSAAIERQTTAVQKRLTDLLEGRPVAVEAVAKLEGNRAGKHRWVTSELA